MFERRMGLPTVSMDIRFFKPAVYGDVLDFTVNVRAIGRSSLDLETEVQVRDDTIWTIKQRIVLTSTEDHKSRAWPDDLRNGLTRYLTPKDVDAIETQGA
jgi:4-hydroxybenzoyl-CoA thioesterase